MTIRSDIERDGYALLEGFCPEESTLKIVLGLGRPEEIPGHNVVQTLAPRSVLDAPPNTYSGHYGYGEFPLHTDFAHWYKPPRFVVLRSIVGAASVPTMLLDGRRVCGELAGVRLSRALVRPRRPNKGSLPLLSLLQRVEGQWLLRWDERYLRAASGYGRIASAAFADLIRALNHHEVRLSATGDTLIVDNWRMLHGRGGVSEQARTRVLQRCYVGELCDV